MDLDYDKVTTMIGLLSSVQYFVFTWLGL